MRRMMLKVADDEANILNLVYKAKSELSSLFLCSLNYLFSNVVLLRGVMLIVFLIVEFNAQICFLCRFGLHD